MMRWIDDDLVRMQMAGGVSVIRGPGENVLFADSGQYYDVRRSGVIVGTGLTVEQARNNLLYLNNAFATAASLGLVALLPIGVIEYHYIGDDPSVNSNWTATATFLRTEASISGHGKYLSILKNMNAQGWGTQLRIRAEYLSFTDFGMRSNFVSREFSRNEANSALKVEQTGAYVRGLRFQDLDFNDLQGGCILLKRVIDCKVSGITARQTSADIVHITALSDGVTVSDIYSELAGDDTVAVIGYNTPGGNNPGQPKNIRISGVTCKDIVHGRGVAVVGGHKVQISDVFVEGCTAAGVLVGAEPSYPTHPSSDVTISNVVVRRCGSSTYGAIAIGSSSETGYAVSNVSLSNAVVRDCSYRGITFVGANNVVIENSRVDVARSALHFTASQNVSVRGFSGNNLLEQAIYVSSNCSGYFKFNDVRISEFNTSNTGSLYGVQFQGTVPFLSRVEIDNFHLLAQSVASSSFIGNSQHANVTKYGSNITFSHYAIGGGAHAIDSGVASTTITLTPVATGPTVYTNTTGTTRMVRISGTNAGTNVLSVERLVDENNTISLPLTPRYYYVKPGESLRITMSSITGVTVTHRPVSLV